MAKINGYIARMHDVYGYGFINPIDGSKDVFFHASSLMDTTFDNLREGDCVNFDVEAGPKGPAAANVARDHSVARNFIVPNDPEAARLSDEIIEISTQNLLKYAEIVKILDSNLIQFFIDNPNVLHQMDSTVAADYLQQLYAEIMKKDGYKTEPLVRINSPDGGRDIIGIRMIGEAQFRTIVQCKHSRNRVRADPIRALNGVLDRFSAHAGIVVTTNHFTKPAIEEKRQSYYKITLQDFESFKRQLKRLRND